MILAIKFKSSPLANKAEFCSILVESLTKILEAAKKYFLKPANDDTHNVDSKYFSLCIGVILLMEILVNENFPTKEPLTCMIQILSIELQFDKIPLLSKLVEILIDSSIYNEIYSKFEITK